MEDVEGTAGAHLSPDLRHEGAGKENPAPGAHEPVAVADDRSLAEWARVGGLSDRALRVCQRNGLHSLAALCQHAKTHGGLQALVGVGKKTQVELEDLLARYAGSVYAEREPSVAWRPSEPQRAQYTTSQLNEVRWRFDSLSPRARNALQNFLNGCDLQRILDGFILTYEGPGRIRNVGVKTVWELEVFRRDALQAVLRCDDGLGESVAPPSSALYTTMHRAFSGEEMAAISRACLPVNAQEVNRWALVRAVVEVWRTRPEQRYAILHDLLATLNGQRHLLDVATIIGVTKLRARQLMAWWEENLHRELEFLSAVPLSTSTGPGLHLMNGIQLIEKDTLQHVRSSGGDDWPAWFVARVLLATSPGQAVVIPLHTVIGRSYRARARAQELAILAEPGLARELMPLLERLGRMAAAAGRQRKLFTFREAGMKVQEASGLHRALQQIMPHLVPGCVVVAEGLRLNTHKRLLPDLLEDALDRIGAPAHVSELRLVLRVLWPDVRYSAQSIRGAVVRDPARFVSFSRTSTYGLRRWETEHHLVKGGTIRDIVAEYLAGIESPAHMDAIEQHVRQYRPGTHASSIHGNLKLDTTGRFLFLANGVIGLAGKRYDGALPARPIRVKSSHLRTTVLRRFIGKHRRELATYLAERSGADPYSVDRAIEGVVASGRLTIDAQGIIRHVQAGPPGPGNHELPLDWSA